MESQSQLTVDGQAMSQEDYNLLGKVAALADDRLLADLLHLLPYTGGAVAKAVMPYGTPDGLMSPGGVQTRGLVFAGNASGAGGMARVQPFRAIIGTRTPIAADPGTQPFPPQYPSKDNWRDIRSVVFAASSDGTNPGFQVNFAANSSGNRRWDKVVAKVTVDAPYAVGARIIKPVPSGTAGPVDVVPKLDTTCVLQVIQGTPGSSAVPPATPADDLVNGIFYIPLANVLIANGFNPPSSILPSDAVHEVAPLLGLSAASTGAHTLRPAGFGSTSPNPGDSFYQQWGATGRPPQAMPTTFSGAVSILVPVDISVAPADGQVIDGTIDWRQRIFMCRLLGADVSGTGYFPWEAAAAAHPGFTIPNANGAQFGLDAGQSFIVDDNHVFNGMVGGPGRGGAVACSINNDNCPLLLATNKEVGLYVDMSTGELKLYSANSGGVVLKFLLEVMATGPYPHST